MANNKGPTVGEMIGERYGELTVVDKNKEESKRQNQIMLNCICTCGKTAIVPKYKLLSGKTKNCGKCYTTEFTGMTVGDFYVINKNDEVSRKRQSTCWNCRCTHCGYEIVYSSTHLRKILSGEIDGKCYRCESINRKNIMIANTLHKKYFGNLEIIALDTENSTNQTDKYICKCSCGRILNGVLGENLRKAISLSCGCSRRDSNAIEDIISYDFYSDNNVNIGNAQYGQINEMTHDLINKTSKTVEIMKSEDYTELTDRALLKHKYNHIIGRTTDPNNPLYEKYGAVGRGVSQEWYDDFEVFYNDVVDRYRKAKEMYPNMGLNIDRIENDKCYSKDNIRFIPTITNSNNSDTNVKIPFRDQIWGYATLHRAFGNELNLNIYSADIKNRLNSGWTVEEALSTPLGENRHKKRVPISPIYYVDDVKEKHKSAQGIHPDDIDYSYNSGKFDVYNSPEDVLKDIIKDNKEKYLFPYLRELGKPEDNNERS